MVPVSSVIGKPLRYRWYVGSSPPFVGVAVNTTVVPKQTTFPGSAAILTLAGKSGFTVMAMTLDVAGLFVVHSDTFDVSTTLIASPFTKAEEVYTLFVAPMIGDAPLNH